MCASLLLSDTLIKLQIPICHTSFYTIARKQVENGYKNRNRQSRYTQLILHRDKHTN